MQGVYLTWMISALALGVILLPVFKPKWMELKLTTFVDFFRRYWLHILILFVIYNAKDGLDEIDRILMANTGLDMTPWIYAIEGDLVLHLQQYFEAKWLTVSLTHFYVAGFMFICYVSVFYFAYFDDRWMADRVTLTIAWVYILAVPFYLFFNVRVTGGYIPEMKPLAYSLNPEIADWFRRIDPFTNCMPSLHIGIPYAVWLCIKRFDNDERWKMYQNIVLVYVILTSFTIIYLGIHWILDIAGGMIVAFVAVNLADKTSKPIWNVLDERTINSRLVSLLTNPKRAYKIVVNKCFSVGRKFLKPTSRETGIIGLVLVILVTSVITWDLTHQSLSARGVEAPEGASGADGWLVTLENTSMSGKILKLYNLSNLDNDGTAVIQPQMSSDSTYRLVGDKLVMANQTEVFVIDVNQPDQIYFQKSSDGINQVELCELDGNYALLILNESNLSAYKLDNSTIDLTIEQENISLIKCRGNEIVYLSDDSPKKLFLSNFGVYGGYSYDINASADEETEEVLLSWGTPVDLVNATITDFVFDQSYLLVNINVSAVDRIVLVELATGNQRILGDAKYPAYDPSIRDGVVAWAMKDHLDPSSPLEQYLDGEIMYMNINDNFTQVLTADEIDQWNPIVLEQHLVYFEETDGGVIIQVHSWEPELKTYSNVILQTGTIFGIVLIFIYLNQKQNESKIKLPILEQE